MVVSSVLWGKAGGPEQLGALDEAVFESYVAGLRDAGWRGDARVARLGFTATAALRYGPLTGFSTLLTFDERRQAAFSATEGQPFGELVARYGQTLTYVLDRADEARALLASLA